MSELQEILDRTNKELSQSREASAALGVRIAELEAELTNARRELSRSEELSIKQQREQREVSGGGWATENDGLQSLTEPSAVTSAPDVQAEGNYACSSCCLSITKTLLAAAEHRNPAGSCHKMGSHAENKFIHVDFFTEITAANLCSGKTGVGGIFPHHSPLAPLRM